MTIEEMREKKKELGLSCEMIANLSGLPLSTVQKVFSGTTKSPRKPTIDAISRTLLEQDSAYTAHTDTDRKALYDKEKATEEPPCMYPVIDESPVMMMEALAEYKASPDSGLHTLEDYYALPDERRAELIDGIFYDMGPPAIIHQYILGEVFVLFRECAEHSDGKCEVFISPCDVRLDSDDYTIVQPDLLLMCRKTNIQDIRFEGAPDMVLEILSPSTRKKDMTLKLHKYSNAGVREYWIVDPKNQIVIVHYFEDEDYKPVIYGFDSEIPISISSGKCSIDFAKILERIRSYYGQ